MVKLSREPKHSLEATAKLAGIPRVSLKNWLDRGLVPLDAEKRRDKKRIGRKQRRFSDRDVELLRRTYAVIRVPMVRDAAKRINREMDEADRLTEAFKKRMKGHADSLVADFWANGGAWNCRTIINESIGRLPEKLTRKDG